MRTATTLTAATAMVLFGTPAAWICAGLCALLFAVRFVRGVREANRTIAETELLTPHAAWISQHEVDRRFRYGNDEMTAGAA